MDYPTVSIIIIAYNEEKMLPLCLEALTHLDYPKSQYEIIVVDNKSTDKTKDIIKSYPVTYIFEGKKGRGSARNRGIRASCGTLIAFSDADCIVREDWLGKLVRGFDHEDLGGCGGIIASHSQETPLEEYFNLVFCVQREAIGGDASYLPFITTCNSIFRRDALDKVNLFDELLCFGEDIDISWRLLLQGYQFKYIPDAVVWHRHCVNVIRFCEKIFRYGATQSLMVRRYSSILGLKNVLKPTFPRLISRKFIGVFILLLAALSYFAGEIYGRRFFKSIYKKTLISLPITDRVVFWKHNDFVNILQLSTGTRYSLQGVGARAYELLRQGYDGEGIIRLIVDEYDVNIEKAKEDFLLLTEELRQNGIL